MYKTLRYLHTDHLNTPRLATDAAQLVLWRWDGKAFGDSAPTGSITVNLRLPGQYFDSETGLHYNWNRYYDPKIGRYISSDPIGLAGGLNTYAYVFNNPLRWVDPTGFGTTINPDGSTTYDPKTPDTIHDWVRQQNNGRHCGTAECGAKVLPNPPPVKNAGCKVVVTIVCGATTRTLPLAPLERLPFGGTCTTLLKQICDEGPTSCEGLEIAPYVAP